ncbi:MAG: sensor histidine kinase [Halobacteriota archaeon]
MGDPVIEQEDIVRLLDAETAAGVHEATVEVARRVLDADTVHLVHTGEEGLEELAVTTDARVDGDMLPLAADIVDQLDLIGRSHVFDDIRNVRSIASTSPSSSPAYTPRALLLVPIETVGLLVATATREGAFDEADRRWAEQLASLVENLLADDLGDGESAMAARLERIATVLDHDFADPLTVARGALELAQETDDPDHFARAHRAIDRIEHLVAGIERMARADEHIGRLELVELRTVVDEVWPAIDHEGATADVRDSRPIVADRYALEQLVFNLLSNAVDHGGAHVRVGCTDTGFFVEDDGPGIPSALHDDIFAWGSSSRSDHKGIGLSIVTQICDAHGWEVDVTEGELGGARFEVIDLGDAES